MKSATVSIAAAALASCSPGAPDARETFDPLTSGIADIRALVTSGAMSCTDIVQAYLDRIEAYDRSSGLNAVSSVNPRALDRAAQIDARIAEGEPAGPLACAPILVKDNYDTHDLPTTAGSTALADNLPPDDAFMVARLREADAIVIAKTNMAEWAFSPRETVSLTLGATANAYDLTRTPAGSSGGSASGVAAGFGVAALGTDTGNSIRGPSSHLGLFGIRPTLGLTSRDGIIPLLLDRDIGGPMTRSVEDAALMLSVLAGEDPADPMTALAAGRGPFDYTQGLDRNALRGMRLAVLAPLAGPSNTHPGIQALFEQALEDLEAAGAEIAAPVTPENFSSHAANGYYCPTFRADMADYMRSLGDAAPFIDIREVFQRGEYLENSAGAFAFFTNAPLDRSYEAGCPAYPDHPGRRAFLEDVTAAMDEAGVDALLYPTWAQPPAPLETAFEDYAGDNSQLVAPATGMPAATVPMGFDGDGLPAGLQILARPFDEAAIFAIAYAYEHNTAHRRPPEGFPPLTPGE